MVVLKSIGNMGEDRFLKDEKFPHMDHKVSFTDQSGGMDTTMGASMEMDMGMQNQPVRVNEARNAAERMEDHEFFISHSQFNKEVHLTVYGTKESIEALLDVLPFEGEIEPRFGSEQQEKGGEEAESPDLDSSKAISPPKSESEPETTEKSTGKSDRRDFVYICQECNSTYQSTDSLQKDLSGNFVCPEDGTVLDKYQKIS